MNSPDMYRIPAVERNASHWRRLVVVPEAQVIMNDSGHWDIGRIIEILMWCTPGVPNTGGVNLVIASESLDMSEYRTPTFSGWSRCAASLIVGGKETKLVVRHRFGLFRNTETMYSPRNATQELGMVIYDSAFFDEHVEPWTQVLRELGIDVGDDCSVSGEELEEFFRRGAVSVRDEWDDVVVLREDEGVLSALSFRLRRRV